MTNQSQLETVVLAVFPWLIGGLLASSALLLVPASADRRWDLIIHLCVLVLFSLTLTWRMPTIEVDSWFPQQTWPTARRFFAAAAALVVVVTGITALVTLASTAAMRYPPSLQFLQLLSALDIAWVVAGTTLAVRHLLGRIPALLAGGMMSVVCVLSILLYLAEVGLSSDGGWLVDGGQMLRLIIPFDVAAAVITLGLLAVASRHSADGTGKTPVI